MAVTRIGSLHKRGSVNIQEQYKVQWEYDERIGPVIIQLTQGSEDKETPILTLNTVPGAPPLVLS